MQSIPDRRLAAIVFTDIAGFTALSAEDEEKALLLIDKQRELLQPIVELYKGKWLKEMGDGLLLSFRSTKQAVNCAIDIQKTTNPIEDLNLRIGIHQGDILEKDGDVFGDDVNIASRIEPFAAVGGVAITRKVQEDISSSPEFTTKYIGQPKLKGVEQQIRVFCITSHGLPETVLSEVTAKLEDEPLEEVSKEKVFRAQLTFKNVILFIVSVWLFTNSFQFISENLIHGSLLGFSIQTQQDKLRVGIMDFGARSSNIDLVQLQAIKSELYKNLQRYKRLALLGDFELSRIDEKSFSRKELSTKLNADYLLTGYLTDATNHYLLDSELYQSNADFIATHYSQTFPILSLQETSKLIADSLSRHLSNVLGLSRQPAMSPPPGAAHQDLKLLRFLGGSMFDVKRKTEDRVEITQRDETYRALVQGKQHLEKETFENNLNAIVQFETALLDDSTSGDLISALAEAYCQRGQLHSGAEELLAKGEELLALAITSKNISTEALATAHYLMSKILLARDDLNKARLSIRKARKLNRSEPRIHQQFKEITKLYLQKLGG